MKNKIKIGALIFVGWFALMSLWPLTFAWLDFLQQHLHWSKP